MYSSCFNRHSGLLLTLFAFTLLLRFDSCPQVNGISNPQPKPPDQLTDPILEQPTLAMPGHQIPSTEVSCELPGPHSLSNLTAFVSLAMNSTTNGSHVNFLDNVRMSQGGLDSMGVQHPTLLACTIPKNAYIALCHLLLKISLTRKNGISFTCKKQ